MTFVEHRRGKNQRRMKKQWSEAPMQQIRTELLLSKPTTKTHQMVKIYYLPFLFIECLEFSKIHYNLFDFEIQIILLKVGFYFLVSIVLKKWLLMVFFEFFKEKLGHGYDVSYFCLFLA